MTDRDELVQVVQRLIDGDFDSERETDVAVSFFSSSVPHPRAMGLIYYWVDEFDHAPSAEEVVDRALAYRPIEL